MNQLFKHCRIFFLVALTLAIASLYGSSNFLQAKIYKWVDEHGVIQFTDDLGKVPAKKRGQAERNADHENSDTDANISIIPGSNTERDEKPKSRDTQTPNTSEKNEPGSNATDGPKPTPETADPTQDQSYWQDRTKNAQEELQKAQDQLEQVHLSQRKNLESGPGMQERQANLAKQEAELNTKIQNLKQDLEETIPNDARKQGVPPGWVR